MKTYLLLTFYQCLALFAAVKGGCSSGTSEVLSATNAVAPDSTIWKINDYRVTMNGRPFFANGVSYSPVPWGSCSAFNPFGDFTIKTWSSVWQRDLKLMRANGVNLLKTYNTLDSLQLVEAGLPSTWDHDHKPFLDSCWNNGKNPVYVLMGYAPPKNQASIFTSATWSDQNNVKARATIQKGLEDLARDWGSHPAVMGFVMANEINSNIAIDSSVFFTYWNDVAITMKKKSPGKLVTLANVDDSMITVNDGNQYMTAPNFFWSYNSYRGNWTNSNGFDVLFSTYKTATQGNKRPLMLTEWGAPASTHNASGDMKDLDSTQMANLATYVTGHFSYMLANRSDQGSGVCIGGAYFEWTDEWWKADPIQCNEPNASPSCDTGKWNPGPNTNNQPQFPGGYWDEEGFGLFSISPVDTTSSVPVVSGGCIGPWDKNTNAPYASDSLTMRAHAKALFSAFIGN